MNVMERMFRIVMRRNSEEMCVHVWKMFYFTVIVCVWPNVASFLLLIPTDSDYTVQRQYYTSLLHSMMFTKLPSYCTFYYFIVL